jgi:LytS/YehU family sensor histidine kinase
VVFLLTSLLMVVFLGVAIKMILHWRQSREDYQKLMREKIESELKFLKAQLNPHFLFNTLNNLYYLSSQKSDRAPQAILQLSEMLDYLLISGKAIFVPLADELKQVDNYIALEHMRYQDRVKIAKHVSGDLLKGKIAPMILITLIENSFKHGVMPAVETGWIDLSLIVDDEWINIVLRNCHRGSTSGQGVGLENLKSQLDLIYKDDYDLKISRNDGEHEVTLKLMIK